MVNKSFQVLYHQLLERQTELRNAFIRHDERSNEEEDLRDEGDHAIANAESFLDDTLMRHFRSEYDEIEHAIKKIEEGTYGICEMCGDSIDIERLFAKPHARYCIVCHEHIERENGFGRRR